MLVWPPSRSLTDAPSSVSDHQAYSPEDITAFRRCPLHLFKRGLNRSHHKLRHQNLDATGGAGKPAGVPPARFQKRAFLRYQRLKYVLDSLLQTSNYSISAADKQRRPVPCCDCAKVKHTHRPRNGPFVKSNTERPRRCQTDKDGPGCTRQTQRATRPVWRRSLTSLLSHTPLHNLVFHLGEKGNAIFSARASRGGRPLGECHG